MEFAHEKALSFFYLKKPNNCDKKGNLCMIYRAAGEQVEGPGTEWRGFAGDGAICAGGTSGPSAVPSALYADALRE